MTLCDQENVNKMRYQSAGYVKVKLIACAGPLTINIYNWI